MQYPPNDQPQQPQWQPPTAPTTPPQYPQQQPGQWQQQPPMQPVQQAPQPRKKPGRGCLIAAIIVGVLLLVGVINAAISGGKGVGNQTTSTTSSSAASQSQATQAPSTPQPTPTPKPSFASFGDGTHVVGSDIKAGTYRTRVGSSGCYYARLSGFGGSLGEIIENNNSDDPNIVTIAASDKGFESRGCGTWTKDLSRITVSKTSFGGGMYFVGVDIEPGTYKNDGSGDCYWSRLSGFGGTLNEIIANDNVTGSTVVTISAGDKGFSSARCGTWKKVG